MSQILVVDDDPHIREVVAFALQRAGYVVRQANDGAQALRAVEAVEPDLIVLDIVMPELDGTEVCRTLRKTSKVPIIFLSSRDDEIDKVVGLELGSDDYVTKPFSPAELVSRVRAVLRRSQPGHGVPTHQVMSRGLLRLDMDAFRATYDGKDVVLTVTEFGLLRTLLATPSKVFSRDELMQRAYDDTTVVSDRTIDSHMRRVRQKFASVGADVVETVHGVGYKLRG